jgi:hypothetical protein
MTAALGVSLVLRFVWSALGQRSETNLWRDASALNELVYVGAHALLGAGIGLLFWLSWGLSALVQVPWWQRGVVFGVLNATVFGAIPVLIVRSLLAAPKPLLRMLLVEMFLSSLAASLACSWTWSQSM